MEVYSLTMNITQVRCGGRTNCPDALREETSASVVLHSHYSAELLL